MFHRFDLYAQVHKGIRLALNGLCHQAGSVDCPENDKFRLDQNSWSLLQNALNENKPEGMIV